MKNSLFKRVAAAAAAAPLALTQCLTAANAANINSSVDTAAVVAAGNSITLENEGGLTYIAPGLPAGATEDGYIEVEEKARYEKYSEWNDTVFTALTGGAKSGVVDAQNIIDSVVNAAPANYKQIVSELAANLGEIKYSVAANGDITITADIADESPVLTGSAKLALGDSIKKIADDYVSRGNAEAIGFYDEIIANSKNAKLGLGGTVKLTIYSSSLENGTEVKGEVEFTDLDGVTHKGTDDILAWVSDGVEELRAYEKAQVDQYADKYGINKEKAYEKIDKSANFYANKVTYIKNKIDAALSKQVASKEYGTVSNLIKAVNNRTSKISKKLVLPETASGIAGLNKVQTVYNTILDTANDALTTKSVDIQASEIGALADTFYDVTAGLSNGVAEFSAKFEDKETEDAKAYVSEKFEVEATESWKEITIKVDFANIKADTAATADIQLKRVVIAQETTTTTSTTSTTTTTTTTTTDETTTTTTTTTENPEDTTTTTTTTENPEDTTTTTTTTENHEDTTTTTTTENPEDTTTTTTTTENPEDTTTTSTTENPEDTTTTTTTTENPEDTTTTTVTTENPEDTTTTTIGTVTALPGETVTVVSTVVHFNNTETVGFYLNINTKFKEEQLKDITYSIDTSILTIDEFGEIIGDVVTEKGAEIAISDKVDFGEQTPESLYNKRVAEQPSLFAYQVDIYATEDIIDEATGAVIASEGNILRAVNGSTVSVTAYIGVKGDSNFDFLADANDASTVLVWYANVSTGANAETTQFSSNDNFVVNDDGSLNILDDLAAFLCDVNNEQDNNNWNEYKPARLIDATDASSILTYYAEVSTGTEGGRQTWNDVLGNFAPTEW